MSVDAYLAERCCPTCAESAPPESAKFSSPPAEDMPWEELRAYWDHLFKKKVFFSYYRCARCGLMYCPKYFTPEMLATIYENTQHDMVGVPQEALLRTQRGYFDALKRHSPLSGGLLEIGPDIGQFAELCVAHGHFDRYWMFEPSASAHAELGRRLAGKNFQIFPEMFTPEKVPDQSVSVAVIIHVLDHLIEPKEVLEKLRSRLTQKGVLLIVTHDESSLLAKVCGNRWPPYCLLHPQLYKPQSMKHFLESTGYKVLEISKSRNHFPATYLLKHALAGLLGLRVPIPQINSLLLPLKLGNILTIATPKK